MARHRRWRWIATSIAIGILAGSVLSAASGWADRGAHRCAGSPQFAAEGTSWRTSALAAASCQAWRHMHRHQRRFGVSGPRS
jgi:hypothetical protein